MTGPRRPWLVAAVVATCCCSPAPPPPHARVVAASPSGTVAPEDVEVAFAFSAPVDRVGLEDGRYLALCRRDDLREVSRAAEAEGGVQAGAPVVPAEITVEEGGRRVALRPVGPLAPDAAWAAVLSSRARGADGRAVLDADGRARATAVLFETGPASDRRPPGPRWLVPPHGPVPSDVRALRVRFDEPVRGGLALGPGGPPARSFTVDDATLGLELLAPASPGPLAVDVAGVSDAAGNPASALEALQVSACASAGAPAPAGPLSATPGTLAVALTLPLAGMGRLVAEVSARPDEPACGTAPVAPAVAPLDGEFAACPGWDPCAPTAVTCPAALVVPGLCPGRAVRVRVAAEDLAGHRAPFGAWREVASLPPAPAPVLTEVLADADAPEQGGEYVELANLGTGDLDLGRLVLSKRTGAGRVTRCRPAPLAGGSIGPGAHALVVGGGYDGRYPVPAGTPVWACGAGALLGGLANDRPVAIALEDDGGSIVSSAGVAEVAPRCPAGALERIHPAGPDAAVNWACPGTRTPGTCNRSTPTAECPRQPW